MLVGMATTADPPVTPTPLRGSGLPPGPAAPRAWQTAGWVLRPYGTMDRAHQQFGDRFTLRFGAATFVVLADPADVKEVFTGDPGVFHAGKGNVILLPFLGEKSILLLDDAEHLSQRKLLLPPFHGDRMRAHVPLMEEVAAREVASWPTGEPFKLQPRMAKLTLEVILRIVFGVDEGSALFAQARTELAKVLDAGAELRRMLKLITLGPERVHRERMFADIFDPVDRVIASLIEEHRARPDLADRDDILSMLLLARHEDGAPMSDQELHDELLTLLIAGHETTATALSWAIERLVRHPEQMARLTESLAAGETEYVDAVIRETLRLRPVLPFAVRELTEDTVVGGWSYPAGTWLAPSIHLVQRRPDLYPDPHAFQPERWLGVRPNPYEYFPFGGGVRRCIGAAFAETEMRAVLAAIVSKVQLSPVRPESERVRRRVITLVPAHGTEIIARPIA